MAEAAALRAATSPAAKLQADIDKANAAWAPADSALSMYAMNNNEQLREHTSLLDAARVPDKALGAVKVLDAIKSFYKEHGERFAAIWQRMAEQPRRHLLSAIAPHMPRFPGDKNAGGQRGSSEGISILAPELNQLQLTTDPQHLLKLLDYIVTEDLAEQYLADRDMLKPLVAKGVLQMNMQERNKYAFMVGQSYVGQTSQLTSTADAQTKAMFRDWEAQHVVIPGPLWYLVLTRRFEIFQLCALIIDEMRTNVFGVNRPLKTASAAQRCLQCSANEKRGGGALSVCSRCKVATYCCKECQKAHYKAHKLQCARLAEEVAGSGRSDG